MTLPCLSPRSLSKGVPLAGGVFARRLLKCPLGEIFIPPAHLVCFSDFLSIVCVFPSKHKNSCWGTGALTFNQNSQSPARLCLGLRSLLSAPSNETNCRNLLPRRTELENQSGKREAGVARGQGQATPDLPATGIHSPSDRLNPGPSLLLSGLRFPALRRGGVPEIQPRVPTRALGHILQRQTELTET